MNKQMPAQDPTPQASDEFGPCDQAFQAIRLCARHREIDWSCVIAVAESCRAQLPSGADVYRQPAVLRSVAEQCGVVAFQSSSGHWYAVWTQSNDLRRILLGEAVVLSNAEFDALANFFPPHIASIANPQRLGLLDAWVVGSLAALKQKHPEELSAARKQEGLPVEIPAPNWRRVRECEFFAQPRPFDLVPGQWVFVNGLPRVGLAVDAGRAQVEYDKATKETNDRFAKLLSYYERSFGPVTRDSYEALIASHLKTCVWQFGSLESMCEIKVTDR